MSLITRRTALATALLGGAAACSPRPQATAPATPTEAGADYFLHGVASGDPGPDSVVIWTRFYVEALSSIAEERVIGWQVASDEGFSSIVREGEKPTSAAYDWTVKVLVTGLEPGRPYFYRFNAGGAQSPVGRTKTLPQGSLQEARFAVVSCTNYPFGYFNVYNEIARRSDLDAVIHLGDYIYEYGRDGYGGDVGARLGREHEPAHETITLDDYRRRHAQYKADPASRAMHAAHPLISTWDDHETANDASTAGAQNHDALTEGEWDARRRAALQAYYEWMPVRDPEPGQTREALFRAYSYGDLLTLAALETRLMARSRQIDYSAYVPNLKTAEDVARFRNDVLWDESREMMGAAQLEFFDRVFRQSVAAGQPWRIIANQTVMAEVIAADMKPHIGEEELAALEQEWPPARAFVEFSSLGLPINLDTWDGYPAARERFFQMARNAGDTGFIVITGDNHSWWANDLRMKDGTQVGVELVTHSVTSPSPYRRAFLGGRGSEYAQLTSQQNKSIRHLSGDDDDHGYIELEVRRDGATARFLAVDTVEAPEYNAFEKAAIEIGKSASGVEFVGSTGVTLDAP